MSDILSRKRWKMAMAQQRNSSTPNSEREEDRAALDGHDLALRTLASDLAVALELSHASLGLKGSSLLVRARAAGVLE
jgi:hypothetical protein